MNPECLGSGLCWGQEEDRESVMTGGREGVRSMGLRGLNTGPGWFVECVGEELVEAGLGSPAGISSMLLLNCGGFVLWTMNSKDHY